MGFIDDIANLLPDNIDREISAKDVRDSFGLVEEVVSQEINNRTEADNRLLRKIQAEAKERATVDNQKLDKPSSPNNVPTKVVLANGTTKDFSLSNTIEIEGKLIYELDTNRRFYNAGSTSSFANKNMFQSWVSGLNVLPKFEGKVEEGNIRYTSGFVVNGADIFPDYIGNTNYRPSHPAHDSWVATGRELGTGFLDGTNVTLFGTTLYDFNDVPYANVVTAMGKGISNARGKYNTPSRTAVAECGYNMRNMMDNVLTVGGEIWFGDIGFSTVIGNGIKTIKYIFNSVILGNQIADLKLDPNKEVFFDNDVIIGSGIYKDPDKYVGGGHLLIGCTDGYGYGVSWDSSYVPLLEGHFRKQYLNVNGELNVVVDKDKYLTPTDEVVLNEFDNTASSYSNTTKILTLKPSASTGQVSLLNNLPKGEYLMTMESGEDWTSGTWGYNFGGVTDSGNGQGWKYKRVFRETVENGPFVVTFTGKGTTSQTIKILIEKIVDGQVMPPEFSIKKNDNSPLFELRNGDFQENAIIAGNSTGRHLVSHKESTVLGSNSITNAVETSNAVVIGNNINNSLKRNRDGVWIGNNINDVAETSLRNVSIGYSLLRKSKNNNGFVTIGASALSEHLGEIDTVFNNQDPVGIDSDVVSVGLVSGWNVTKVRKTVFLGNHTGQCSVVKNGVVLGANAAMKSTTTSENEIVIGAYAKGHGNNTATIGDANIKELYVGGPGAGIVLTSPDGTKSVKISIDNNGSLRTTPFNSGGVLQ